MKKKALIFVFGLFIVFCYSAFAVNPPSDANLSKLDRYFQKVVAAAYPSAALPGSGILPPETAAAGGRYPAIVYLANNQQAGNLQIAVNSQYGRFVTSRLNADDLVRLSAEPSVAFIAHGRINRPTLDVSVPETGTDLVHSGFINGTQYRGNGVIVLVYDTGIDWKHLAFRDPADTTRSRILAIWDQTLTAQGGESAPAGFSYGVEYTQAQIDNEIDGTPANFVRTKDIEGHGTHVAGIAAGNANAWSSRYVGMAPDADLVVVKGGDGSFNEVSIIDGLTYAANKAAEFGEPVVVNLSLGTDEGPHDNSLPYETAINSFSSSPGRAVVVSAGNSGDSNIHVSGNLNSGGSTSMQIVVPSYTPTSGVDNDVFVMDIWYDGTETVTANVTSPNGITLTATPGQSQASSDNNDGTIELSNVTSQLNGEKNITLAVHDASAQFPPAQGTWTLSLSNASGTIHFDGWLAETQVGNNYVTVVNGNNAETVGMPGTAVSAITIGSFVTKWFWTPEDGSIRTYNNSFYGLDDLSGFSSRGPTRDGRLKPDLAAPGQGIGSALSSNANPPADFVLPGGRYFLSQGTSMSAPHVTGAAALLLETNHSLTADQIKSMLTGTADTDNFTGTVPNYDWGYGKLDELKAMTLAVTGVNSAAKEILAYEKNLAKVVDPQSNLKVAVRFTPSFAGPVVGVYLRAIQLTGNGPLNVAVYTNVAGSNSGVPGTQIGNSVIHNFSDLVIGSYNYIDMRGSGAQVEAGKDYQIVVSWPSGNTITFGGDDGSQNEYRSSIYEGGQWYNYGAGGSGFAATNLHLRTEIAIVSEATGISGTQPGIPETFSLSQNYPNPFNPVTNIKYTISEAFGVHLYIYDITGRKIADLVNENKQPGTYTAVWNARDSRGDAVSSGVYFYRLEAGRNVLTRKMILLR